MSLLGIDLGSSQCKAMAISASGEILATAVSGYSAVSPGLNMSEMDPELFWQAAVTTIRSVAERTTNDPVSALAISSHGETIIPVFKDGTAAGPAIMNSDNRAIEEACMCESRLGKEKVYRITGSVIHPMFPLPKICWLRKHNTDIYAQSDRFVDVAGYILLRMGMPAVTDYSLASRYMAFDINTRKWSEEMLESAQISADQLPDPLPSGTAIGKLGAAVAAEIGLQAGTSVVVGGHDQPCAALGSGAITPGIVADSSGTYECLAVTTHKPILDDEALSCSINSYCHVIDGKYITLAFFPAGIMLKWFCDKLARYEAHSVRDSGRDAYEYFEAHMPKAPTGLRITPHLVGSCNPCWNPNVKATIAGLTPGADIYHVYKGILEGIACEFSLNAEVLSRIAGEFGTVRITGGGSRSEFGMKLRASLTGKDMQTLRNPDSVCLGAAMLAGTATGVFSSIDQAVKLLVHPESNTLPDAGLLEEYSGQFAKYKKGYSTIQDIYC